MLFVYYYCSTDLCSNTGASEQTEVMKRHCKQANNTPSLAKSEPNFSRLPTPGRIGSRIGDRIRGQIIGCIIGDLTEGIRGRIIGCIIKWSNWRNPWPNYWLGGRNDRICSRLIGWRIIGELFDDVLNRNLGWIISGRIRSWILNNDLNHQLSCCSN